MYASSNGTLGGTAGEVEFPNIFDRYPNASLCAFTSVTSGLKGECFGMLISWVETLLCQRYVQLLFWGFMSYGICSAPFLVLCTKRVLHVVPMMFYIFYYFGLLLLTLVGLAVRGCSQSTQIYVCKLIGGDEFLIEGVDSDLLLPAVLNCTSIVGGFFHL